MQLFLDPGYVPGTMLGAGTLVEVIRKLILEFRITWITQEIEKRMETKHDLWLGFI